ncbi:MAG: integrase, partial [Peptococcaceae bacterium BRH_c8a]
MTKEEILKKLKFDTRIRGLSQNTQDEYYTKAKRFQDYYDKPATELDIDDIKNYLYYLLTEKKLAPGSINTYNSGLRFLYNVTLNNPVNGNQIPCHHKQRRIPDILTRDEVTNLFNACDN